jgi:hypothetical protein
MKHGVGAAGPDAPGGKRVRQSKNNCSTHSITARNAVQHWDAPFICATAKRANMW